MKNKILAIIPARGGSKGIPGKNIKKINGKPLLEYTAEAIKKCNLIDRAILSTDDDEIINIGLKLGLEVPFKRPLDLALDDTPAFPVIKHAINTLEKIDGYKPDTILLLQPTSPLRTYKHIFEALDIYLNTNVDTVVSVTEVPHNMNPYSIMKLNKNGEIVPFLNYDENKNLRQFKPTYYARNGAAIYITSYDTIMYHNTLYGKIIKPYFMKKEDSFDIDEEIDWDIVEYILKQKEQ